MTTIAPAYRLTVFKTRSEDSTETQLATPAASALHSEGFAVTTLPALRANLLDNPELYTNASGWAVNSASGSRQTDIVMSGSVASYKVTTTNVGTSGPYVRLSSTSAVPIVTGRNYTFSMYVYCPEAAVGKQFRLVPHWYNGAVSFLSSDIGPTVSLSFGWQRLSFTTPAVASAAYTLLALYTPSAQGVFDIYVTRAQIEEASTVGTYNSLSYGFRPFLNLPYGRKGRFDPLKGKFDNPQMSFDLFDFKVDGYSDNFSRWITQFVGNAQGRLKMVGRRVVVEESLDYGATWSAFHAGRITAFGLNGPLKYEMTVREAYGELNQMIFGNQPWSGSSPTVVSQLLPPGLSGDYGVITSVRPFLSGSVQSSKDTAWHTDGRPLGFKYGSPGVSVFRIKSENQTVAENIASQNLAEFLGTNRFVHTAFATTITLDTANMPYKVPVQIRHPASASTDWRTFQLVAATFEKTIMKGIVLPDAPIPMVRSVFFCSMSYGVSGSTPAAVTSIPTGSNQAGYHIRILPPLTDETKKESPILLAPAHPAIHLRNAIGGHYGFTSPDGRIIRSIPYADTSSYAGDTDNFASLLTKSFPQTSMVIEKPMKMSEFIEKYIVPAGIGYRFEARTTGSTIQSVFVPFDNRLPTTLPSVTLSDADLSHATNVQWSVGEPFPYIRAVGYLDVGLQYEPSRLMEGSSHTLPQLNLSKMDSYPIKYLNAHRVISGDAYDTFENNVMELDLPSIRFQKKSSDENTLDDKDAFVSGTAASQFFWDSTVGRVVDHMEGRFADGPPTISLKCRRSDTVNNLRVGQWIAVDVDVLPDPTSHLRGGIRLCQVTEKSEDLLNVTIGLIDSGKNIKLVAPLLGPLSGSASSRLDIPVTTYTGSVRLELDVAILPTGSTQPPESSSLWNTVFNQLRIPSGSYTQSLSIGQANSTIYARGRIHSPPKNPNSTNYDTPSDKLLSSDWAYSGTPYNSPVVPGFTGALTYVVQGQYADLYWTAANAPYTMVEVAAPSSSVGQFTQRLTSGSNTTRIGPYSTALNPVRVSLYASDGTGLSTPLTTNFYVSSSSGAATAVAPLNFYFIDVTP